MGRIIYEAGDIPEWILTGSNWTVLKIRRTDGLNLVQEKKEKRHFCRMLWKWNYSNGSWNVKKRWKGSRYSVIACKEGNPVVEPEQLESGKNNSILTLIQASSMILAKEQ